MTTIDQLCDQVLIDSLPPGLKAAIDAGRANGCTAAQILAIVDRQTGGRKDSMLRLAVEAYLGLPQEADRK